MRLAAMRNKRRNPFQMKIEIYQQADRLAVINLWMRCGLVWPQNNPDTDILRKCDDSPDLFFVGRLGAEIIAAVMVGYDGHRGWINYLAVSPEHQKGGYGRQLLAHVEQLLAARGCPKINLQIRSTNHQVIEFYQRLGFSVEENISMGKRLVTDTPFDPASLD